MANTEVLLSSRVDGVIISMTRETKKFDHFKIFEKHGIPVVFFNRVSDEMNSSKVIVNDYEGAFNAVEHLIRNGYKKIAHIGGPLTLRLSHNRLNGFMDAMKKNKIKVNKDFIIHHDLTKENAHTCAKKLLSLKNQPDAIFCVNDPAAIQTLLVAKQMGIKVPDQLGIVGFSNDPISSFVEPHLTTIDQPVAEMGRTAMRILLEHIKEGIGNYVPCYETLSTNLIIRQSSVRNNTVH
jgi:DNA-binding LacI/PurR family transcriptional regulator